MKNTHYHKTEATKQAIRDQYARQILVIDNRWTVKRHDFYNWTVLLKGKFYGFYPTIFGALKALPAKMLGEEAKNSLQASVAQQKAINERIDTALNQAQILHSLHQKENFPKPSPG